VRSAIRKSIDHIAQRTQRGVDFFRFLQHNTRGVTFVDLLTTSQIDKRQLAVPFWRFSVRILMDGMDGKCEDGVGPRRMQVQLMVFSRSEAQASPQCLQSFMGCLRSPVRQPIHVESVPWHLLNLQALVLRPEQVSKLLAIYLEEAALHREFGTFSSRCLYVVEDLPRSPGDQAQLCVIKARRAEHAVGFAAASLPVGKDGTVVPFEHIIHNSTPHFAINIFLCGVLGIDAIVQELLLEV
jgi:hypothetical protein